MIDRGPALRRREALAALAALMLAARGWADDPPPAAAKALARGLAWLIAQQGPDGGWHSAHYGALKDGPAVTALALYAAGHAPAALRDPHAERWTRGIAFLADGIERKGTIAAGDGSLDYPTYGAPLWLAAHRLLGVPPDARRRQTLLDYLLDAQLLEGRGFERTSVHYGGWDLVGRGDAQGITTGSNVSVVSFALEALAPLPDAGAQRAIAAARPWLHRCQQSDGGFAFTPEPGSHNNKADYRDEQKRLPRSYGTATCDGLRALVASGEPADSPRLRDAAAWLARRPGLEVVPGFEDLPPEVGWQAGLRFYYYFSLARCLPHLPAAEAASRRQALAEKLAALQHEDGHWANPSARMREDDPLIATPLALAALAQLMRQPAQK